MALLKRRGSRGAARQRLSCQWVQEELLLAPGKGVFTLQSDPPQLHSTIAVDAAVGLIGYLLNN